MERATASSSNSGVVRQNYTEVENVFSANKSLSKIYSISHQLTIPEICYFGQVSKASFLMQLFKVLDWEEGFLATKLHNEIIFRFFMCIIIAAFTILLLVLEDIFHLSTQRFLHRTPRGKSHHLLSLKVFFSSILFLHLKGLTFFF